MTLFHVSIDAVDIVNSNSKMASSRKTSRLLPKHGYDKN